MDAGHPKLLQAEASAGMNLRVVPDHQASHHRPERTGCGAWGNAAHLGLLGLASTDLASRLVEPRGHALLSVLVEVRPQDRAIPAGLHGCGRKGRPPTRLLCPWDSPGKNTGVGCHFLLHVSISSVQFSPQSCPPLCNPMNRSTPGFPVHHQLPEFTQTHIH